MEKRLVLAQDSKGMESIMMQKAWRQVGRHGGKAGMTVGAGGWLVTLQPPKEAKTGKKMEPGCKTSELTGSLLAGLHFPVVPEPSHTSPPTGDKVFK